jgi:putative transmembrane protein PGPGW
MVEHRSFNPVKTKARKAAVLLFGWGFLLLGAVGLFLPFFKGVVFLFVGLLILSSEYVWAHHLLEKIRIRFPGLSSRLDRVTAHKWIRSLLHHPPPKT